MIHKMYDIMLGLAVGDALGVPVEFTRKSVLKDMQVTDMRGGGSHNQPAGTWSDDTSMALATLQALKDNNMKVTTKTLNDIMNNFHDWFNGGKFACCGTIFDIGNQCYNAIMSYSNGIDVLHCGGTGDSSQGNGAVMRIAPLYVIDDKKALLVSRLTHNNSVCDETSLLFLHILRELCSGDKKKAYIEMLKYAKKCKTPQLQRMADPNFVKINPDEIYGKAHAPITLEAAAWSLFTTHSYKDCVLRAVNLGDDTDTVGAVAGALAGALYGINDTNGIPSYWINKLRDKETIDAVCSL